jgi:hypothetical protein
MLPHGSTYFDNETSTHTTHSQFGLRERGKGRERVTEGGLTKQRKTWKQKNDVMYGERRRRKKKWKKRGSER